MKKLILLAALFFQSSTYAYYEVLDTGSITPKGSYQLFLAPQFILNNDKGLNISGLFDFGFNDSSNFRALLGTGTTSFYTGIFYKYIPIPDLEDQPAIGFSTGFTYAVVDSQSNFNLQFRPLISKQFKSDWGPITPYASIPVAYSNVDERSEYPIQLVLGSEFKPDNLKYVSFFSELGFDLSHSFSYISIATAVQFDDENGIRFE